MRVVFRYRLPVFHFSLSFEVYAETSSVLQQGPGSSHPPHFRLPLPSAARCGIPVTGTFGADNPSKGNRRRGRPMHKRTGMAETEGAFHTIALAHMRSRSTRLKGTLAALATCLLAVGALVTWVVLAARG
jgi:hypothetical protein